MGHWRWWLAFCVCLLGFRARGQDRPPDDSANLPIKRVVLYKNGVGYFEHLGRILNNQQVTIAFTSAQLNDVLKSLTVLDLNGGRITGVAYGSAALPLWVIAACQSLTLKVASSQWRPRRTERRSPA